MHYKDGRIVFDIDLNEILKATRGSGILEGLQTTPLTSLSVEVSSGRLWSKGKEYSFPTTTLTFTPDANYPRRSLVYFDSQNEVITTLAGTAEAIYPPSETQWTHFEKPAPPDLPRNNDLALAEVYLPPSATTLPSENILDRRILIETDRIAKSVRTRVVGLVPITTLEVEAVEGRMIYDKDGKVLKLYVP